MIDKILSLGDDQLVSQFQALFPQGIPGGGSGENIALRLDQTIDIPEVVTSTYEYSYRGIKITKTNMTDETTKELSLSVRLDQQWAVFDDLDRWRLAVFDPNAGTRLPYSDVNTSMIVQALDGQSKVVKTIRFTGVILKSMKITSFEPSGTDPSRLELVFIFQKLTFE